MTLLIICAIITVASLLAYLQMKRERDIFKFDFMYLNLETIIEKWPVTKTSMIKILSYFDDIKKCRWQNTEKVNKLHENFVIKYNEYFNRCDYNELIPKGTEENEFEIKDGDLDEISQVHNALRDSQRFD